jgi:hypothetical protein
MDTLSTIRAALIPHAAEIAEAVNAAPVGISASNAAEVVQIVTESTGAWLLDHRHILDSIIAAYDGVPVETVAGWHMIFVALRLTSIRSKDLPAQGIDIGDLFDLVYDVVRFAGVDPRGTVVPFAPRRER